VMGFRCPTDIAKALDDMAEKEDRTRSAQIVRYLKQGLRRDVLHSRLQRVHLISALPRELIEPTGTAEVAV
jgi:predicted transcriptional regulator